MTRARRTRRRGGSRTDSRDWEHLSPAAYFGLFERRELIFGFVRKLGAAPVGYNRIVAILMQALVQHLKHRPAALPCALPDVVLDSAGGLILHPAVAVVLGDRLTILRERVWGAPNVVIDVISPSSARRTKLSKARWYRKYGVQEYWLVDLRSRSLDVLDFEATTLDIPRIYRTDRDFMSRVLPTFEPGMRSIFGDQSPTR